MKCPYCGADNPNDTELCNFCGSYIKKDEKTVINQTIYVNRTEQPKTETVNYASNNVKPVTPYIQKPKKPLYKKWWFWVLVVMALGVVSNLITGNGYSSSKDKNADSKSVWATEYTDLEDFDYYFDGNEVYIKEYKGHDDKIKVNSTYKVDGKDRKVVSFSDGTFFARSVDSVILPEGTTHLDNNTFNSCGIKYLYIPKSLKSVDNTFWGYFHDMEKIYYGGSESDWKKLCKVDRSDVDVKEIVYNADSSKLN